MTAARPLAHLRVLDLTTELGALAPRIFVELGASVTRIVPPTGDPLRTLPPFAEGPDGQPLSLYALRFLEGRAAQVLDPGSEAGRREFRRLAAEADVVVESQPPGALERAGIGFDDITAEAPRLVWTSITPFGRTGPKAGWQATDLIGMASGGLMSLCGDPDRAPLRVSVEQGYALAGIQAVVGTLAALHARNLTGRGQLVDVSMQEAVANCLGNARLFYEFEGLVSRRAGGARAYGEHGSRLVYPCADGYVAFSRLPASMRIIHDWVVECGGTPGFDPEEWAALPQSGPGTPGPEKARELEGTLEAFFARFPKMQLYEEGQRRGLLICPVSTPADLVANEQLRHRRFFQPGSFPELGREALVPGPPFRVVTNPVERAPVQPADAGAGFATGATLDSRDILQGVRVADFSWVGVGPLSTQQLAWMGAEVIRVESSTRLDVFRSGGPKRGADPDASAYFANCNRDKLGITLNLKHPSAREAALRLVASADIVVESFTPGFMASVGLGYDDVRAVNPSVIMLSASMEGGDGPHAQFRGFGLTLQATVGFTYYTGWPDRPPTGTGVAYTDWVATGFAATALLSALEHRRRTGQGQYIDLSQLEACTWALDAELLEYTVNGRVRPPLGNRHPSLTPHGVFRCRGEDEWVALAVRDDADWERLTALLANDGFALPRCDGLAGRRAREDEVERIIGAWAAGRDRHEVAESLQSRGIPAHAVATVADVHHDAQLRARGHFWRTRHPVIGEADWDGPAYRLAATPMYPRDPAPCLGQDNHRVYTGILGYSEEEFARMVASGVLD